MTGLTRRTLLGGAAAAAGLMALGHTRDPRADSSARAVIARHLAARESLTYDASFAAFADSTSVAPGEALEILAVAPGNIRVDVYRVGQAGSRPVASMVSARVRHGDPGGDPRQWPVALRATVDQTWTSGLYLAVARRHDQLRFAPFVVRSDAPDPGLVVQVPLTTYHAYNAWGGASLYPFNSPTGPASVVSLKRPFDTFDGAGFLFYGDWQLARWLARSGYNASYITSTDLHRSESVLDGATLFLSAFHDEYWSTPMRQHLDGFVANGGNAAFLGANSIYWRVRIEGDSMTCHKAKTVEQDPDPETTATWRSEMVGHPEHLLLGSHYESYEFPYGDGYDWTVARADHWLYDRTGLRNGDRLEGLVGYEWDRAPGFAQPGVTVLSSTSFTDREGLARRHEATERVHPGGGTVVNIGTTYWPRFLEGDDLFRTDGRVQTMTRTLIDRLGAR